MTRKPFETDKLLTWLREVLKRAAAVDVDVVVVDKTDSRSSVHITLHDVPGPLGGFQVGPPSPTEPRRLAPSAGPFSS